MESIRANLDGLREQIRHVCERCGRDPGSVRLIAVSKVKPATAVDTAFAAGQVSFGENYVQEFRDKQQLVQSPVEWHFIGHLQSNKVKYLRGKVAMIHSVDRLSLAQEISRQWETINAVAPILIQVNVGDETSKAGCTPREAEQLVRQVALLPHVQIRGLMCLPPYSDDPEQVRPYFRQLRELAQHLAQMGIPGVAMDQLSMGMSGDFEVAIEEGATLIRIGTAIFGSRS